MFREAKSTHAMNIISKKKHNNNNNNTKLQLFKLILELLV